jgi:hypothetical protein
VLAQQSSNYRVYFELLNKFGVRDVDMVLLKHIFRKKTVNPMMDVDKFTEERQTYKVVDEELWESNNFGKTFRQTHTSDKNQHVDLHEQRIYLLESDLKKEYHVETMSQLKNKLRIAMISAASETVHRLWGKKLHLNICLSNDMNDENRVAVILNQLIRITPLKDMELIFTNICSCYQENKYCKHLEKFDPELVLMPHSIYYLSDDFINYVINKESRIIFTAHIFKSGTTGEIGNCVKFKCYMNEVNFNVLDDKQYNHKNFMPALLDVKNITTNATVTKLNYWFYQENSMHCVGYIEGRAGQSDFKSSIYKKQVNQYVLGVKHALQTVGEDNAGAIYLKEDKDEKFMVKVLTNSVQCIDFRVEHFSFFNEFFSNESDNLKDDKFTHLAREFYIKYPEMCIEISNEVYNKLFAMAYKVDPQKLDFKKLQDMFLQTDILIGNNSNNKYMTYVVLKNILYDVLTSFFLIDNLLKSKIIAMLQNFPIKENLLDKITTFILGKTELDENLQLVKKQEQTYNKHATVAKESIVDEVAKDVKQKIDEVKNKVEKEVNDKKKEIQEVFYEPHERYKKKIKKFFEKYKPREIVKEEDNKERNDDNEEEDKISNSSWNEEDEKDDEQSELSEGTHNSIETHFIVNKGVNNKLNVHPQNSIKTLPENRKIVDKFRTKNKDHVKLNFEPTRKKTTTKVKLKLNLSE